MHILVVTSSYPPEIRSSSHLMAELAEELVARNHRVTVATTYPEHNLAEDMRGEHFETVTQEGGVRVLRISVPIHPHGKANFIVRGISQVLLPYIFQRQVRRHIREKVDAVLVYSPPLTLTRLGLAVKRRYGARLVLNIQDIFPQNAIDLGILKNPIMIRFFERMELNAYRGADFITAHSIGNRDFLMEKKGIQPSKITVLHNWMDLDQSSNDSGPTGFREKLDLNERFVFFFGGVIGPSQGLDIMVEAARRLTDHPEIAILLVGDGIEKERLEEMVRRYKLKNVIFHPFISKETYNRVLKEIDVGVLTLTSKNKTPVVPGKILGYMAAEVPILAVLNKESDGHRIVGEAGCGFSDVYGDPDNLAALMLRMYKERDQLPRMGKNGFDYALNNFSKKQCVDKLMKILETGE